MPLWTISFANLFDRYKRKSGGVLKQVTSVPSTLGKVSAISPEKFFICRKSGVHSAKKPRQLQLFRDL